MFLYARSVRRTTCIQGRGLGDREQVDNDHLTVAIDPRSGDVNACLEKALDRQWLCWSRRSLNFSVVPWDTTKLT